MSFERSILIPYELFQKCRLDKDKDVDILLDKTLPSDEKLKLYHQSILQNPSSSSSLKTPAAPLPMRDDTLDYILHSIPDKDKPNVRAILDIIKSNPSEVNWNGNSELILNNNIVSGSNLINLLLYFTKNLPVTSKSDVPTGAHELYKKLLSLGMPASWVKVKPPIAATVTTRSKKKKRKFDVKGDTEPIATTKWASLATE